MPAYRIEFQRSAEKYLRKLPSKTQEKILVAIKGILTSQEAEELQAAMNDPETISWDEMVKELGLDL